jgi:hypothetical protein
VSRRHELLVAGPSRWWLGVLFSAAVYICAGQYRFEAVSSSSSSSPSHDEPARIDTQGPCLLLAVRKPVSDDHTVAVSHVDVAP